jgi:hypothetical protein
MHDIGETSPDMHMHDSKSVKADLNQIDRSDSGTSFLPDRLLLKLGILPSLSVFYSPVKSDVNRLLGKYCCTLPQYQTMTIVGSPRGAWTELNWPR